MISRADQKECHQIATADEPVNHPAVKHFCSWCRKWYVANKDNATIYVEPPAINVVPSHGGPCKPCRLKFFPQYNQTRLFEGRKSL